MEAARDQSSDVLRDPARLKVIREVSLLDTAAEESFDRLARLAVRILQAPVALISLVDADRQFFKSSIGLSQPWATRRQTPLSHSFCRHVVATGRPLVVADARAHPLVYDNPAIRELGVVAYLGVPLITSDAFTVGSLCAIDSKPRQWSDADVEILTDLAAAVMSEIELRRSDTVFQRLAVKSERQADLLSTVLSVSPDAVFMLDRASQCTYASPAASKLVGKDARQVCGQPLANCGLPEPAARVLDQQVRTVLEEVREVRGNFDLTRPEGPRFYDYVACPVVAIDGRAAAVVVTTRDVTERRLSQEALERASLAKDQFLSVLSHELRNLLAPVLMTAGELESNSSLPEAFKSDVRMIRRNVQMQVRLIDDLLDLTAIGRGKVELRKETAHVHDLVRQSIEICGADLRDKDLNVRTDLGAGSDVVMADPARLQQVFVNLLKNATKFTPPGGAVAITTASTPESIRVEVSDTGIGIEAANLGRIFNAYEQGGTAVTRRFGGLGLGLAICKALVEAHGGTITAHSPGPGRGATLIVKLPAGALSARADAPAPQSPPDRPIRVLLVEDHAGTARALGRVLRRLTHEVTIAGTAAAARNAAAHAEFDLVISDLGLPDGSGLDLMRELRHRYALKGIALTGYTTAEDVELSRQAGFAEHLTKPVNLDQLCETIRRVAR